MKVYLDTSALQGESRYRGIGRYIEHLKGIGEYKNVTIVTSRIDGNSIILSENANDKIKESTKNYIKKFMPRFLLKKLKFFHLCKSYYNMHFHSSYKGIPNDIDIIHAPANYFPYSLRNHPAKKVVSILDVIPLVDGGEYNTEGFEWFIKKSFETVKYADKVITISDYSKQDIIKYLKVPEDKIEVITLGFKPTLTHACDIKDKQNYLQDEYNITGPYLLYVGAIEERKNIENLLSAFSNIKNQDLKLVLVGKKNNNVEKYKFFSKTLGIEERVYFTGYINDSILPIFYKNAVGFVFPSFYEGFGLPVLEAMSLGVPVITSNVSSIPEVTGDSAILVDPRDVNSITQGIQSLLDLDIVNRERLINKGLERVKQFKWEDTLLKTKELYSELIKQK